MKYFKYKINYWIDGYTEERTDEGIVAAQNYGQAAENLVKDYGEDHTDNIYLSEICNDGEYCISKDDIDCAFKENITE